MGVTPPLPEDLAAVGEERGDPVPGLVHLPLHPQVALHPLPDVAAVLVVLHRPPRAVDAPEQRQVGLGAVPVDDELTGREHGRHGVGPARREPAVGVPPGDDARRAAGALGPAGVGQGRLGVGQGRPERVQGGRVLADALVEGAQVRRARPQGLAQGGLVALGQRRQGVRVDPAALEDLGGPVPLGRHLAVADGPAPPQPLGHEPFDDRHALVVVLREPRRVDARVGVPPMHLVPDVAEGGLLAGGREALEPAVGEHHPQRVGPRVGPHPAGQLAGQGRQVPADFVADPGRHRHVLLEILEAAVRAQERVDLALRVP